MTSDSISVVHLPNHTERNPYQQNMINGIQENGINAKIVDNNFTYVFSLTRSAQHSDIVHVHWLQSFYQGDNFLETAVKLVLFPFDLLFAHLLGINIVWTVHNVRPHEVKYPRGYAILAHIMFRLSNAVHVHGKPTIETVLSEYYLGDESRDKCFVIPHGNYIDNYQNSINKRNARKDLNISSDKVLYLFLGHIRPYKGVPELIDAFKDVDRDANLVIAGKPYTNDYLQKLSEKVEEDGNICFIPEFIPEDELEIYFNAADVAVFPFQSVLTSGSVLLAFSFGCPAVVPKTGNVGAIEEGTIFYEPGKETVRHGLQRAKEYDIEQAGDEALYVAQQRDWNTIGNQIVEMYETVLE